jgi:uncharacterized protein
MKLIDEHHDAFFEICKSHNVKELYLFGSAVTESFGNSSDIDMLIRFSDINISEYFDNYMDFKEKLENLFNRPVDLVEDCAVRNPIFRRVLERNKQLVYERKSA